MIEPTARGSAARGAGKSPGAYRTIAEVAEELDLPQHVLRFWETKFPQIRPLKRGGGRRYYRPGDVEVLRHIRELLYSEGYTIRGAQKLLRQRGGRETGTAAAATGRATGRDAARQPSQSVTAPGAIDPHTRVQLEKVLSELEEMRAALSG